METNKQLELGVRRGPHMPVQPRSTQERRALTAPFLSFLWPGLGQLQQRRTRTALFLALPPLLVVGYVAYSLVVAPEGFALRMLAPSFALLMIGLIAAHGVWRLVAILDAWLASRSGSTRRDRAAPLVVLLLSLAVIGAHVFAGVFVHDYSTGGQAIFSGGQSRPPAPLPADDGSHPETDQPNGGNAENEGSEGNEGNALDDLLGEQLPSTELGSALDPGPGIPREGPLTVLLVGVDSAPGRDHALTDALMVGAFDPQEGEMALVNIPRDTGRFPLYNSDELYPDRINSFLSYARQNPELFPEGAIRALTNQMAFLVGIPIHYYAVLDMAGFERMVDLVGGVTVDLEYQIADPVRKLYLEPGRHHLDGAEVLAYVRSRFGPNNNDYRRAQRQQQVIRALAGRLRDPGVALRLPQISREAATMARTNIPVESLEQFLAVLDGIEDATPTRVVLQPRRYAQRVPADEVGGRFMTELKLDAVEELSIELFGEFSLYSGGDMGEHSPPDLAPPTLP
jgi:LCP family protein required for cell wall assembly